MMKNINMKYNISLTKNAKSTDNLVILSNNIDFIKTHNFTVQEIEFVEKQMADKSEIISVNQYNRHIFICNLKIEKERHIDLEKFRKTASKLCSKLNKSKIEQITIVNENSERDFVIAFAEGLLLANYQFLKHFAKADKKPNTLSKIEILDENLKKSDIDELENIVEAVYIARDLINEPVSHLNAEQLSAEAKKLGKIAGFDVEIFDKAKIEKLEMGGLLAVNKGSIDPPTFTILEWKPKNAKNTKPIVLVGKGIVYDTGGLSLKPTSDSMDYMKCDMSGAAAVIGALFAVAKNEIPVHVVGLIPATDNRPSGNAYAPGDVITMYDKSTVEVLNSDAEGRMILADALSYAQKYKPEIVIDIATLTGSAHVAIGKYGIVTMGNASEKQFEKITNSGNSVFERIVRFPFWEEYDELIKSDIADIKNVGGRDAGAITAGKFLEHFTDYEWIHLDIAGPSFLKTDDSYRLKGGTGVGVRLFYDFIKNSL